MNRRYNVKIEIKYVAKFYMSSENILIFIEGYFFNKSQLTAG